MAPSCRHCGREEGNNTMALRLGYWMQGSVGRGGHEIEQIWGINFENPSLSSMFLCLPYCVAPVAPLLLNCAIQSSLLQLLHAINVQQSSRLPPKIDTSKDKMRTCRFRHSDPFHRGACQCSVHVDGTVKGAINFDKLLTERVGLVR